MLVDRRPDAGLLEDCRDEPAPPAALFAKPRPKDRDQVLSEYNLEVADAGADCRQRFRDLRGFHLTTPPATPAK